MSVIAKSVGKGGVNLPDDVKLVRQLLGKFLKGQGKPPLPDSGVADSALTSAIESFQSKVMGFPKPDGRIDPGGKTIARLLAEPAAKPAAAAAPAAPADAPTEVSVTYGAVDKALQIVSPYSIAVVGKALVLAKMNRAVITSTLRLPADQARIMYGNARTNLKNQFALYGSTGDAVLKVFEENEDKSEAQIINLMRLKIEELLGQGRQVSRHVTTVAGYAKLNVFDIGVNSTKAVAGKTFSIERLTGAFLKLKKDGYIKTFIDETAKSNRCWHLEIVPNAMDL